MTNSGITDAVWARWSKPENEQLRQAVLAFGGNISTEAEIDMFQDVALVRDDDVQNTVKGIFYLTTKRLLFLPRNTATHSSICQAEYDSLRTLSGSRHDFSISLVDTNGAIAKFQFPTAQVLFQCFNLLRKLSETTRKDETEFKTAMAELCSGKRDETPFTSIEVELQERTQSVEITLTKEDKIDTEEEVDPVMQTIEPVKRFYDKIDQIHFDIHLKLKILFVMSLVSFCLKFIPFVPLCALCLIIWLLFTAWKGINRDLDDEEETTNEVPDAAEGFVKSVKFIRDWFFWENPRNGMILIQSASAVFIGWMILPTKIYHLGCIVAFVTVVVIPFFKGDGLRKIVSGNWFCT